MRQAKKIASSKRIELVSPEAVRILRFAAEFPVSNSELLARTGWKAAHLSQRTSPLISAHLIDQAPDESDRRKRSFTVTREGRKRLNDIDTVLETALLSVFPGAKGRLGLLLGAMRQVSRSTEGPQRGGTPVDAFAHTQLSLPF